MKLQNILGLLLLSVLALSSCSDDDDYTKGKETNKDGNNVYFSAVNETPAKSGTEDRAIEIIIERDITDNAAEITVPLVHNVIDQGAFKVPSSVTFAENETMTVIEVEVSENLEMFQEYILSISIPENYTYPYAIQIASPIFKTTVIKEDYQVIANGVYSSFFFGKWEQPMEYSEILGIYRFPDVIVPGVHFYMLWDVAEDGTETCYFTDSKGNKVDSFTTGYMHSLGEIYADALYEYGMGMFEPNTFYFPIEIVIPSQGLSGGSGYDKYTVAEWFTE